MKPITKQLIIGAFILALVTVASLGIRHIRFSANRAKTIESPVIAEAEPEHHPTESDTVVAEPDLQYADALDSAEETPSEDHSETKSFKDDYAKSKGSKGLEKISMGDNEDLYITGKGELWYVSKGPDGKTIKMQVHIDETTGEMTVVDWGDYAKSDGSESLEQVSLSNYENLYITQEGGLWYTSEQGSGYKAQVEIDDTTGEITVIEQFSGDDDK
jgi:hypothetical protein